MQKNSNRLLFYILIFIIFGVLLGGFFPKAGLQVKFLGTLFLKALLMIVAPLIFVSITVGIIKIGNTRRLGKLGVITLVYYLLTTSISVSIGLFLSNTIKPGVVSYQESKVQNVSKIKEFESKKVSPLESLKKVIESLIPKNIFKSMAENEILPIIFFSILFGIVLLNLGEKVKNLRELFESLDYVIMEIVRLIMYTAPIGVGALIAGKIGESGGFKEFIPELIKLSKYSITVISGLVIHGFIVLPLILKFLGKESIKNYFKNLSDALLTAFSTASSSATLPVTMNSVIKKSGVKEEVASFVLPLGATVNMDGTALYEAVAAIFIAQSFGIPLGFGENLIIFLTATLAAIGAAGIPQAGLVTMVMVLKAVNLPVEGITLILIIDWFLDRCRTTINVWGDAVGAKVVERFLE